MKGDAAPGRDPHARGKRGSTTLVEAAAVNKLLPECFNAAPATLRGRKPPPIIKPAGPNKIRRPRTEEMHSALISRVNQLVQGTQVLIVDDNQYMRKVIRNLLVNLGVKNIQEAGDGVAGLEAIRMYAPDVVILDWEMPLLSGPELLRIIRSPGVFPSPDVAVIMLTGHVERWRVIEATRLGAHEFLKKPVSAKALMERLLSIVASRGAWCVSASIMGRSRADCLLSRKSVRPLPRRPLAKIRNPAKPFPALTLRASPLACVTTQGIGEGHGRARQRNGGAQLC